MHETGPVTRLLRDWSRGDLSALDRLAPMVYAELRRLAGGYLGKERPGHTLQPTELVHEAFLRMIQQEHPDYQSRAHFLAIAARQMRRILVDHARHRKRLKRGGGEMPADIDLATLPSPAADFDVAALDEALNDLAAFDERKSQILEMHFFGGMLQEEIAAVYGVHVNTVARDLRLARAWLQNRFEQ